MDFKALAASASDLGALTADAVLLVLQSEASLEGLPVALAGTLKQAVRDGDFAFKAGRSLYLHQPQAMKAPRVVAVAAASGSPKAIKAAMATGLSAVKGMGVKHLCVALPGVALTDGHAHAVASAVGDAVYVYSHSKPSAAPAPKLQKVSLACAKEQVAELNKGLQRAAAVADGVALARECANRPGNHCTPSYLAKQAQGLGKQFGMKVEVLNRAQVEKLGMGSFLAVAQASAEPLKFIVVQYHGAAKTVAPIVLVGKGITFDTGGISLKPAAEMDEMKFDMGGAASVLGTLRAVGQLKAKVNLVGIIPACENMPGGRAVKPGDVVTSMSGQTIEILNTDAEGRLILCDALTYAERFKPAMVVDIATLTGACVVALGGVHSGMFSADDTLANELLAAGQAALDTCWRLPLDEEYDEGLKSNFADMGNVGSRAGGAVTAAMFLKRFTAKYRWAHLDIAGTAWKSGAAKGGTGRPVGLLTHFILAHAG